MNGDATLPKTLSANPIKDISPLAKLESLQVLTLSGCAAQEYSPLSGLVHLKILLLDHSTLADVSPLLPLTNLKHLYLQGCPINNYYPLSDIFQGLEQKDFTIAFTLSELGFHMDDSSKQAIFDGEDASVRINHIHWGAPQEDWFKNCIRTVFSYNDAKIDIGYYPQFDAYVVIAAENGELVMNYVYYHAKNNFTFGKGDRASTEQIVSKLFTDLDAQEVLLTPIQTYLDTLQATLGISANTLFDMPFDDEDEMPSPYERLGFTPIEYQGTCIYKEETPHALNISVHRTEWDENAPAENLVDWSMEFYDGDVNGYVLHILYYAAEGKFHVTLEKDGVQAAIETCPSTGVRGGEWPNLESAHKMFNDAFKTQGKELYAWAPAYFEQVLQERFGMGIQELYELPIQ